ncbi:lysine transporter LysE [Malaciobacter molluscorum LMG 25693]|uniref:Lysine transporter LysE n=1 Tax=Malaciobacter molluscorum LMG 25693 TaxID=870501 RepID=A0A2G1DH99_9BACT|nr:LysE family translocator [Malaciobacter molluscorum]AXX91047.1 threonine/homoserine/homoserine lactone efflux protein, LysE family [Malaciobacter molluscorum LMG 25693]PHO17878.1 lysine transporter LysE [Malaciobacter molluscorum LMG 25693]RXJ93611.1 lysine transporter LysE [Malaciobacter molluscorum]
MDLEIFLQGFIPLATAHFIALLSPGADFFILLSTSSKQGKLAGILTAFGIAISNGIYILLALFGIMFITNNQFLFESIKLLGSLYLIYISYHLINSKKRELFKNIQTEKQRKKELLNNFFKGFLSAILNPKNSIFYFTMFSISSNEHISLQYQYFYASWMFFAVLIWDIFIVYLVSHKKNRIYIQKYSNKIEKISGFILLLIAILILIDIFCK